MNLTKFLTIFLFSLVIIPIIAIASPYDINHLTLLAVQETPDGSFQGSTADLYLELRDGSGRVFLDTSPLTKIDTQISTRYAKEIACNYFDLECDHYDFIYTIRADSSIIGGPSAGAAIAALTALTVLDLEYDETITITGTINSGGIVGPVGGTKEKIEAAARTSTTNISRVLVAMGSSETFPKLSNATDDTEEDHESSNDNNNSNNNGDDNNIKRINSYEEQIDNQEEIDEEEVEVDQEQINEVDILPLTNFSLIDYADQELGIEVTEVTNLNEVVYILSGKELISNDFHVEVSNEYNQIMQDLSESLCARSKELENELLTITTIEDLSEEDEDNTSIWQNIVEKKDSANGSIQAQDYYSAASFCFGLNVYLNSQIYINSDFSKKEINDLKQEISKDLEIIQERVRKENIKTISDLQTKMVVRERLSEAKEFLEKLEEMEESDESYLYNLAYAKERLYSSLAWMHFFQMNGKSFLLDEEFLKNSCYQKVAEAEERYQYAKLYLPILDTDYINEDLISAKRSLDNGDYELCLMQAAQAKAEATTILSSIGLMEDNLDPYIESKLNAAERKLSDNIAEDIFPILGYSYYQYAKTLQESDPYLTLLYLEFSLELSELDIYFKEDKKEGLFNKFRYNHDIGTFLNGLVQGLIIGALLTWLILQGARKRS